MTSPTTSLDLDAALADVVDHEYDATDGDRAPDAEPYITALPASALFADHTYQRELDEHRVVKMAANFRIALVGILEVSDRGADLYAILDGQHRWAMIRDRSFADAREPHIACRVHRDLTVDQEAKLYHELNTTRKQLTGWDRWLARRGAGDPVVRDIEMLLDSHGLRVALSGGGNVFRSTRTAEKIVELNGLPLLDEVIGTVRSAWPDDQGGMDGSILHGVAHVLDNYSREELNLEQLVEALAGVLPRQLSARAGAVRELHKGTLDRLMGHVVVERYNGVKGTTRLVPFFERVKPTSKTKTARSKYEADFRLAALEWARETRYADRAYHTRMSPELREAFLAVGAPGAPRDVAAHADQGQGA